MSEGHTMDDNPIHDQAMPLLDHLMELRKRLIWSLATFAIAFVCCYHFAREIYLFLASPLGRIMAEHGQPPRLIYTSLPEAFFSYVKVAMFGAIFVSFPMIAAQAWIFIAPGLYRNEKRAFLPFLVATPVLFVGGGALAYYVVFPMAWQFFLSFQATGGDVQIDLQPKVSEYLNLVTKLILAFGIAFELPVVLSLLARVGIVNSRALRKFRRYAYVCVTVAAAIMAPPDAITMGGLAVALGLLYEISILAARIIEPKLAPEP